MKTATSDLAQRPYGKRMSKTPLSLHLSDLSDFTRALARELKTDRHSYLTLMNMIARAAGYQNVQHLR
ncbi:MAG: hypothetical protein VW949_06335, partial [Paracoccaceae bacterium]